MHNKNIANFAIYKKTIYVEQLIEIADYGYIKIILLSHFFPEVYFIVHAFFLPVKVFFILFNVHPVRTT